MSEETIERVLITIYPTNKRKALKRSKKLFGAENLSGYIRYLMERDNESKNKQDGK